jgi:hypothetical protein
MIYVYICTDEEGRSWRMTGDRLTYMPALS